MKTRRYLLLERLEDRHTPTAVLTPWPDPGHLTLSFAPDGTNVGGYSSGLSRLFNNTPTAAWQTEILRAFQTWAVNGNVNIGLVADGGQDLGSTGALQGDPRFGDVRVASRPMSSTVVSTAAPFAWEGTTWAGDVLFNSRYHFAVGATGRNPYDLFTVALHEAGHTLGVEDNTADPSSAMYGAYTGPRYGLSAQDVAELQALYGTRQSDAFDAGYPNDSFADATSLDSLVGGPNVSADITTVGDVDYYKITTPLTLGLGGLKVNLQASGLSLLMSTVVVYDASFHALASAAARGPLQNDLAVSVPGAQPLSTYYLRVGAATGDVFGVGGYRLGVTYPADLLSGLGNTAGSVVGWVNDDLHSNDVIQSATALLPAFGIHSDARFDYLYQASITDSSDRDFYQIVAPLSADGSPENLRVIVWEAQPNGLHPVVHVYDELYNPVAVQVLANNDGLYSLQLPGVQPGAVYYLDVEAWQPGGTGGTGNYTLGVKFDRGDLVHLAYFGGNTLTASASTDTATLTVSQDVLVHLSLGSRSDAADSTLTMTVVDAWGRTVLSLTSQPGRPPATAVLYLRAGTYSVRYSARSAWGGLAAPLDYWLFGEELSDPIGPYQSDPTNSSTGSGGSTDGSGTDYTGSSSTPPSGSGPPYYY